MAFYARSNQIKRRLRVADGTAGGFRRGNLNMEREKRNARFWSKRLLQIWISLPMEGQAVSVLDQLFGQSPEFALAWPYEACQAWSRDTAAVINDRLVRPDYSSAQFTRPCMSLRIQSR